MHLRIREVMSPYRFLFAPLLVASLVAACDGGASLLESERSLTPAHIVDCDGTPVNGAPWRQAFGIDGAYEGGVFDVRVTKPWYADAVIPDVDVPAGPCGVRKPTVVEATLTLRPVEVSVFRDPRPEVAR